LKSSQIHPLNDPGCATAGYLLLMIFDGSRATRTLTVVFRFRIGPEGLADGLLTS
jgi:hypothetical protein